MVANFFFVFCSDNNAGCPDECCRAQEVRQGSIEVSPHWRVSRPGLYSKVQVGRTALQQMLYCHLRCAIGAHCRMTSVELGEHAMSESAPAMACPQSHNDHLVYSRKGLPTKSGIVRGMLFRRGWGRGGGFSGWFTKKSCILVKLLCFVLCSDALSEFGTVSTYMKSDAAYSGVLIS